MSTERTHLPRSVRASAAALVALALLMAGCTPLGAARQSASPAAPVAALTNDDVLAMAMTMQRKQAELPEGFPVQVPVIDGTIDSAGQYEQGAGLWIYELSVDRFPADVAQWYRSAYANASWVGTGERTSAEPQAVTLTFEKGGAQSIITVRDGSSGATLVEATVGIGAPAGETY